MATIISSKTSGVGGLAVTGDASGILQLASADGTTAISIDASQNVLVNQASADTGAKLSVTGGIKGTITSGTAVASTSGTSIDFTGIPSWAKRVTVMFSGVSTNGTSNIALRIGSGSIDVTGYLGACSSLSGASSTVNSTTEFNITNNNASNVIHGAIMIANVTSNSWVAFGSVAGSDAVYTRLTSGSKSLAGVLDRVRITTVNGTDTFDAGSINIMYEG